MHKEITQQLPANLKLFLCYRKLPTLLAILVLFIGGLFSAIQLSDFDFREFFKLHTNTAVVKGTIAKSYYTGISGTIGDDEGTYYINAFVYDYDVKGEHHQWISYSRSANKKAGDKVSIEYNVASPQYSVIQGYDYRTNGANVLLLLLFPLAAISLLLYHVYKGISFNKTINNGVITTGKLSKKKVTYEGDYATYTKLTFSYFSDAKKKDKHKISVTTSDTAPFVKQGKTYIIFSKTNPKNALILNDLSSQIANYVKKNWIT